MAVYLTFKPYEIIRITKSRFMHNLPHILSDNELFDYYLQAKKVTINSIYIDTIIVLRCVTQGVWHSGTLNVVFYRKASQLFFHLISCIEKLQIYKFGCRSA